jgi:2-polyprenyl-3-methyl-5-hydroxy-6-metoxy-1,4-benzoquinol methylase
MVTLKIAQNEMRRRGQIAEALIARERPELLDLYLTYQNEAVAARELLDSSLKELKTGAEVLEVGGGILALTIQLASEGFAITTVEPVGGGFSEIPFLMDVFSEIARTEELEFSLIADPIEDCRFDQEFDFIFSINVMEHLENPYLALIQLVEMLGEEGKYRFFCPNYDFPYEPHFGKWLWRRRNKSFYLQQTVMLNRALLSKDQHQLYFSINWITLRKILEVSNSKNIKVLTNKLAFFEILTRSLLDPGLKIRHPKLVQTVVLMRKLGILGLARLIPTRWQPVMDVTLIKSF